MARIVVVGSVASDEVVRLTERCREGAHLNGVPGETRLGGGGANSAVALAAAGHHVTLVTAVGEDETGQWQVDQLDAAGVDVSAIRRVAGPSTRSILLIDPAGERTIVNLGRVQEPEPPRRLLDLSADLIYVRTRSTTLAPLLADMVGRQPIIAHIPPMMAGIFPAHVVVASASDLDADALADPMAAARVVAGPSLEWMVLTRGEAGAEAFGPRHLTQAAVAVAAVDTTGAGDAFAAGLCHALSGGDKMPAALAQAVRWGAAKVAQEGSALTGESVRRVLSA
ncbi:MAG: carbohydrate kinase [Rhodospirillaceae bacterium]|nr:carbohydrate kinase [Rhodospirillales bacterium]